VCSANVSTYRGAVASAVGFRGVLAHKRRLGASTNAMTGSLSTASSAIFSDTVFPVFYFDHLADDVRMANEGTLCIYAR